MLVLNSLQEGYAEKMMCCCSGSTQMLITNQNTKHILNLIQDYLLFTPKYSDKNQPQTISGK